jgi:hypothetical protein
MTNDLILRPQEEHLRKAIAEYPNDAQLVIHLANTKYIGLDRQGSHVFQHKDGGVMHVPAGMVLSVRFPAPSGEGKLSVIRMAEADMQQMALPFRKRA